MQIILKNLSKWKLMLYVLFAVLYSLQGLLLSFIIQFAGEINPRDKGSFTCLWYRRNCSICIDLCLYVYR